MFVDAAQRNGPWSGTIGRQPGNTAGIPSRIDGVRISRQIFDVWRVSLRGGLPVELSTSDRIMTNRYLYGVSLDYSRGFEQGSHSGHVDAQVFGMQQRAESLVDRTGVGGELRYVNDQLFLASYGDCLTDAPLNEFIEDFRGRDAMAAFLSVRPSYTFHVVTSDERGRVERVTHVRDADIWINGGYFIFRPEIFDHIRPGEDLVTAPFQRLIEAGRLIAYRYDGFWMPMDTIKEMQDLELLYQSGSPPWAVWRPDGGPAE